VTKSDIETTLLALGLYHLCRPVQEAVKLSGVDKWVDTQVAMCHDDYKVHDVPVGSEFRKIIHEPVDICR